MIKLGKRWGNLEIAFLREGDRWRATGSVECLLAFDPSGEDVLLSPLLPKERYFIDVEPPVVVAPGSEVGLTTTVPVGAEIFIGRVKIGEFMPRMKRTYLGPTTEGVFALYVRFGERYEPGLTLELSIINKHDETLCFDELKLAPWLLSVFEHDGKWFSERLVVLLGPEEMDVKHTDIGPGRMVIRGKRESEINKRFKRFVERLKDVI